MAIGGLGSGLDFLFDENTAEVPVNEPCGSLKLSRTENSPEKHSAKKPSQLWRILSDSMGCCSRFWFVHTG